MVKYELKEEYEHLRFESWYTMGRSVAWDLFHAGAWFPTEIDGDMLFLLMPNRMLNMSREEYEAETWV